MKPSPFMIVSQNHPANNAEMQFAKSPKTGTWSEETWTWKRLFFRGSNPGISAGSGGFLLPAEAKSLNRPAFGHGQKV